jgi:16S rRNA (uracil1498-N3)-methyltransferase
MEEIQAAKSAGCRVVSLGPRILRMETAAIVFPALVLYELGSS